MLGGFKDETWWKCIVKTELLTTQQSGSRVSKDKLEGGKGPGTVIHTFPCYIPGELLPPVKPSSPPDSIFGKPHL